MAESSIRKLSPPGDRAPVRGTDELRRLSAQLDPAWRQGLGLELRRRRLERGLTQEALGLPLTKAYVSSIERGRVVPSLPALRLMLLRLDTTLGAFFASLDGTMSTGG